MKSPFFTYQSSFLLWAQIRAMLSFSIYAWLLFLLVTNKKRGEKWLFFKFASWSKSGRREIISIVTHYSFGGHKRIIHLDALMHFCLNVPKVSNVRPNLAHYLHQHISFPWRNAHFNRLHIKLYLGIFPLFSYFFVDLRSVLHDVQLWSKL